MAIDTLAVAKRLQLMEQGVLCSTGSTQCQQKLAAINCEECMPFEMKLSNLFCLSLFFIGLSCTQPQQDLSQTQSVDIPQTPVKDQGRARFCWAYATIGFVEQFHLNQFGEVLDLNEEALGFYSIAEQLSDLAMRVKSNPDTLNSLTEANIFEEGATAETAFRLLDRYGVIPDLEWEVKFKSDEQVTTLKQSVLLAFKSYIASHDRQDISQESIMDNVLVGAGRYPRRPPQLLKNNKTPLQYFREDVRFNTASIETITFQRSSDYARFVGMIKAALYRKAPLILSFPIDWNLSERGIGFTVNSLQSLPANYIFTPVSSHAVVITDWVNKGSRPGQLPEDILAQEMAKPADALDYVVIKNSWGKSSSSQPKSELPPGYHKIDQGYFKKSLEAMMGLEIVVPRGLPVEFDQKSLDPSFHPSEKGTLLLSGSGQSGKIELSPPFISPTQTGSCVLNIGNKALAFQLSFQSVFWNSDVLTSEDIKLLESAASDELFATQATWISCDSVDGTPYKKFKVNVLL